MIDERDPLGHVNPVDPDDLVALVAMDRDTLFELLEADDRDRTERHRRRRLRAPADRPSPVGTRTAYAGAMAAAAAAVLALVTLTATDRSPSIDVGPADDAGRTTTSVLDDPTSTTAPATTGPTTEADAGVTDPSTVPSDPTTATTGTEPAADPATDASSTRATTRSSDDLGTVSTIDGPFDPTIDLLVLHFDFAHLDDGHAAVAAREIVADLGVRAHVVGGTTAGSGDGFVHDFEPVLRATWGDGWLDATTDRAAAVRRSADTWLTTIDGGGRVWVADGGASDFTAEVVRELRRRRPDLDTTTTVRVVQHNDTSESATSADNLRVLQDTTSYQQIEDGNDANATADLNQPSDGFEAAALAGPNAAGWAVAFDQLPAAELDFSDTVEVLHILAIGLDEVANTDDFARRFLG